MIHTRIFAAVVLLLAAVMPACDGYRTTQAPDVIARMLESLTEVKAAHFEIEASLVHEPREAGAQPLELPAVDRAYPYLPAEVNARIQMHGQTQSDVTQSNDGSSHLSGQLALGGLAFTFAADLVKKAEVYFARIVEAPSLGFFDLATLKGKWIRLSAEEAHPGTTRDPSATLLRQYQLIFRILKEESLIAVIEELPQEKTEDGALYHYEITLERARFAKFYRRLLEETKTEFGDESVVKFNEETLAYIESPEFPQFFEELQKNVRLELWVDAQSFYPRKISYALRLVPPDGFTKLRDKQYRFTLAVGLKDINVPFTVEVPPDSISVAEARALL